MGFRTQLRGNVPWANCPSPSPADDASFGTEHVAPVRHTPVGHVRDIRLFPEYTAQKPVSWVRGGEVRSVYRAGSRNVKNSFLNWSASLLFQKASRVRSLLLRHTCGFHIRINLLPLDTLQEASLYHTARISCQQWWRFHSRVINYEWCHLRFHIHNMIRVNVEYLETLGIWGWHRLVQWIGRRPENNAPANILRMLSRTVTVNMISLYLNT